MCVCVCQSWERRGVIKEEEDKFKNELGGMGGVGQGGHDVNIALIYASLKIDSISEEKK